MSNYGINVSNEICYNLRKSYKMNYSYVKLSIKSN